MTRLSRLKAVAAAAGTCAALLASGSANAFVYSASALAIEDLTITIGGATATPTSFTFNLANSATLNGATQAFATECGSAGTPCGAPPVVLDAPVANAPGSAPLRANNDFTLLYNTGTSYSNADTLISSAQLVNGTPTDTRQIAESLLNTAGTAQANTEVQSNTNLRFILTVGSPGATLALNFLADPDQRVEVNGPTPPGGVAQSNLNASFSLNGTSGAALGTEISWSPQGNASNNCVVDGGAAVCNETADTQDLNRNLGTDVNPSMVDNSYENGFVFTPFGILISGLAAGTYSLVLNGSTSTSITGFAVPEPGTMALLGLALTGLAVPGLRRRSSK